MNVNKKLDRLKQWSKERISGEVRTDTTEEFKALEVEMQLRHDGMDKLKRSADVYIKWLSKRDKHDDRDQQLPVGYFGSTMVSHGDDFEADSEFGRCLSMLGRANERIARTQEAYVANATSSWQESLERSLQQLKDYQAARKKLESRRLGYDTATTRVQKLKREDPRAEEELRAQRAKFDESRGDVARRMRDLRDAERDSVGDLTSFLDAELAYHDRCREVLLQLRHDWPATTVHDAPPLPSASPRSRAGSNATYPAFHYESSTVTTTTDTTSTADSEGTALPQRTRHVSGGNHSRRRRSLSGSSAQSSSAGVGEDMSDEEVHGRTGDVRGGGGGRRVAPPPPLQSRAKKPPPPPPPMKRRATAAADGRR